MADRALFDAYSRDVGRFADAASLRVSQLLERVSGLTDEEAYRVLSRYYPAIAQRYGRGVAARAMAYYQEERDAEDPEQGYDATSSGPGDASWYAQDVDEATGRASSGAGHGNIEPSDLAYKVAIRVLERADRTVIDNARRDPVHPRWAFVAHPGACGFCVMCSSWGWTCSEAGAKAQRHAHCKCTYAVDFSDDPSLGGYDPKAMQDAYAMAEETVHDDVDRQWEAMSEEERGKYKRKGRSAKDVYKTKRVTAEMDRRDRAWLQDPKKRIPKYEILPGAKPSDSEKDLANELARDGWKSVFRPVRDGADNPKRTSDVFFRSGRDDVGDGSGYTLTPVEFKQPTGAGKQTVFHQFESAAGQAHWLVLDARGLGEQLSDDDIRLSASRNVNRPFKVKTGVDKGKSWEFGRVTVLMRDGSFVSYWHE